MAESFSGSVGLNDGQSIPIGINLLESSCQKFKAQLNNFEEQCSREGNITIKTQISKDGYKQLSQLKNAYGDVITKMKQFNAEGTLVSEQVTKVASKSRNSKGAIDEYANAVEKLKQKNLKSTSSFKELSEGFNKVKEESEKVVVNGQKFTKTMTTLKDETGSTTRVIKTLTSETGETSSALLRESKSADTAKQRTNELGGALETTGKKAKSAGVGLADFGGTMVKIAQFQLINKILDEFKQSVTEAIDVTIEFDKALTDFRKVSDLSGESLVKYTQQLGVLGETVGRTTTEMVQNAQAMKQAGYSDKDAQELARVTALYQNVADAEVSSADAGKFVVSQLKAFHLEASQAQSVVDKLNAVSNNYSVSNTDLAEGLRKSASALQTLGNNEDQIIGLITAGTEQLTGQASTVSKGLTTIGINISSLAQKTGELTYNVDGTTKSLSLLNDAGDALSEFDVLQEIAKDWDNMNKSEQNAIATALAGKTRYNVFSAVISNFDDAIKASETSMNSAGSAMEENSKYLDSIQGKFGETKNLLERFVLGEGGLATLIKYLLDATNMLLRFANSGLGQFVIKSTLAITALSTLVKASASLKSIELGQGFIKSAKSIMDMTKNMSLAEAILRKYIEAKKAEALASAEATGEEGAEAIAKGVSTGATVTETTAIGADTGAKGADTVATGLLTTAQEALNIAMKSNPIGLVILAITALVGAVAGAVKIYDAFTVSQDEANEAFDEASSAYDEQKTKLDSVSDAYAKNNEELQKLIALKQQENTTKYDSRISQLQRINDKLSSQYKYEKMIFDLKQKQKAEKALESLEPSHKYQSMWAGSMKQDGTVDFSEHTSKGSYKEQVAQQTKDLEALANLHKSYIDKRNKYTEEGNKKLAQLWNDQAEEAQQAIERQEGLMATALEHIQKVQASLLDENGQIIKGKKKEYEDLDAILKGSYDSLENVKNGMEGYAVSADNASESTDGLTDAEDDLEAQTEETAEDQKTLCDTLTEQISAIEDIGSAYGTLKGAVSEYNKSGKLSLNTLKTLLALNPKYLLALTNNNGKLSLNEKALKAQWKAEVDVYNQTLKTAESYAILAVQAGKTANEAIQAGLGIAQLGNQTQTAGNQANGAKAGLENFTAGTDDISRGANQAINYLNSLGQGMAQFYQKWGGKELKTFQVYKSDDLMQHGQTDADRRYASEHGKRVVNRETRVAKDTKKVKNFFKSFKMDDGAKSWNDIKVNNSGSPSSSVGRSSGGGGGRSRGGGGGSSSATKTNKALEKAKKAVTKAIKANIKALDDQTKAYERSNKHAKKVLANAKKKAKALEDKVKLYEDVKKYIDEMYDDEINKLKELENEFQELVKLERDASTTTFVDKTGKKVEKNYVEVGRILEKAKHDLDKITSKYDYLIAVQERLRRADPQIKATEATIKSLNEELKAKQKVNEEQERALRLKELEEALERAKNIRLKVYRKGQGFVYGQDEDAIREAQKNLDEYKKQKEVDDLQDRIDKAQDSLDALNKVYDDEIEKQEELRQQEEDTYHARYDTLQEWYDNQTNYYDDILEYRTEYKIHSERLNRDITTKEVLESQKRIKNLENEKKKVDAIWEAREKKEHERLILKYTNLNAETTFEKDTYETRIKNLQKFVDDYEKLNARLDKANAKVERAETKANRASKAYDFQKEQDTHQKNAQEKIEKKVDKAKTQKDAYKLKKASDALREYQYQLEKYQKDLLHYIKDGSMDVNTAISAYNKKAKDLYSEYKLKSLGIPFKASALGMNTKGTASMFGYGASALKKKASGDASISSSGVYLVGDSPNTELIIGSKLNGVPMNLSQGTGVVNAKSTKTLAGMLNSIGMMKKNDIGTLSKTTNNNDSFSIGNVTVNGAKIKDGKSFANELLNLKSEMLQMAYRK